jgi:tetratricopeptide (TPR) repeat protein
MEALKARGNALFQEKHFLQAFALYTEALALDEGAAAPEGGSPEGAAAPESGSPAAKARAVVFANRAACSIALENYGSALEDAQSSIALDGLYIKASAEGRR